MKLQGKPGGLFMAGKPTYEELEQRVRELEKESTKRRKAEEAFRESENKFRSLVERLPETLVYTATLDAESTITYIGPQVARLQGYSQKDYRRDPSIWLKALHPDDRERVLAEVARCNESGGVLDVEYRMLHPAGRVVWWQDRAEIIRDKHGTPQFLLGVMSNITERKQAQRAIIESEKKFRNIVNSSPMGIHMYKLEPDRRLVFTGANPSADTLLGVDNSQFIGKTIEEAFPSLVETDIPEHYRNVCAEGEPWHTVQINYEDERTKGAFEVHAVQTAPGKMTAVFYDITARMQAEKALQESEERFRVLFEHAPDPFYINKRFGTLVDCNKAVEKFTGYRKEELIGENLFNLGIFSEADLPKALSLLEKNLQGVLTAPEEFMLFRKNGEPVYGEISTHPVTIGGEKLVLGIARDITARRIAEKEMKKLEAQLRQAQKMEAIGTFAGGIAHDFNNILSAIVGYAELAVVKTSENSLLYHDLQEILRAGLRASDLVKQILTFSRQSEQDLQPVQINLIVKEALKFLRSSLPASIEIQPDIVCDARVLADPTQIHQVLMNLCANAKHAMHETGGVLEVSLAEVPLDAEVAAAHPGAVAGPHLKLAVADSGEGMSAEVLEKIFDPFFTTKGKEEGTGLGLAVVHGVVKSCGGFITVSSAPDMGTTFNVFLPIILAQGRTESEIKGPLSGGSERVLFVDDERLLADIGKQMLERYGYRVTSRTSSVEALELFKAKKDQFDLVITDMTMPNMSGLELAAEIIGMRPDVPIILCTGFSEKMTPVGADAAGIKALMLKPVSLDDLIRTARKVLDEHN
jgi:PAS domain S-box-containing protein